MMMKSQGMIANESIFADEGQELKHPDPDPDKVGAGAVARGRRRTQRAQRRDSRSRLGDKGDGKAASRRIPDRVGTWSGCCAIEPPHSKDRGETADPFRPSRNSQRPLVAPQTPAERKNRALRSG